MIPKSLDFSSDLLAAHRGVGFMASSVADGWGTVSSVNTYRFFQGLHSMGRVSNNTNQLTNSSAENDHATTAARPVRPRKTSAPPVVSKGTQTQSPPSRIRLTLTWL